MNFEKTIEALKRRGYEATAVFDRCPTRTSTRVILVDEDLGF